MFKKNFGKSDDGILVIKKTKPGTCGGTDATLDTKAPKEIGSEEMILFDVTSALNGRPDPSGPRNGGDEPLGYVSAFAAPAGRGTFVFLSTGRGFCRREEKNCAWAFVKEDVFPSLVLLVREENLAKDNGFHSETHGLPENFGGRVCISYASGEKISFSDNQSPVLSLETGRKIAELFKGYMAGEMVELPRLSSLSAIRFEENRSNGGFTKALLTLCPDGTGTNEKQTRWDDPTVYESTKPVEKETVDGIIRNIRQTGLLAWSELPDSPYSFGEDRKLTFVFSDGEEITVRDGKLLPDQIQRGFFNVQLEMTTKH